MLFQQVPENSAPSGQMEGLFKSGASAVLVRLWRTAVLKYPRTPRKSLAKPDDLLIEAHP